jgi:hypothetical protein
LTIRIGCINVVNTHYEILVENMIENLNRATLSILAPKLFTGEKEYYIISSDT